VKQLARLKSGIARGRSLKGYWVLVAWMDSPPALALILGKDYGDTYNCWYPYTNEVSTLDDNDQIVWIGPKVTMPTLPKFDHGFRLQ
jgi:hypothetical protein